MNHLKILNYYSMIKFLYGLSIKLSWKEIVQSIDNRLQNLTVSTNEILHLLNTLMYLRKQDPSQESVLKNLTIHGFIPHQLNLAVKQKDFYLQALTIYNIIEFAYQGSLQKNIGESPQGINYYRQVTGNPASYKEIINELLNIMIKNDTLNNIFIYYNEKPELKNMALELIKQLYSNEDLSKKIPFNKFLEAETCFYECLSTEEYYQIVKEYVSNSDLITETMKGDFQKDLASLYIGIIKTEEGRTPEVVTYIKTGLLTLSHKDWQEEYSTERINCFDLILELRSHNINAELKSAFLDRLKIFIDSIMKGQSISADITSNWKSFVLALDEDNQKTLFKYFMTKINNEDSDLSSVLNLFSMDFIMCEVFIDGANDLVTQCFDKFLAKKNLQELSWLKGLINKCPAIIEKSDKSYTASLKDKINLIIKEEGAIEELKNIIKEIGKLVGIKKFVEKNEEE